LCPFYGRRLFNAEGFNVDIGAINFGHGFKGFYNGVFYIMDVVE
jgi:hypothetical protein